MPNIFRVTDYDGTLVVLAEEQWKQKILSSAPIGHPEVAGYLLEMQGAITEPDLVFESSRRTDTRLFYRLNTGKGEYVGKHLVIVVKYVQGSEGLRGYVSTVYLARGVYSRGRLLWQRKNLITE